jgi:transposase-like protein
MSRSILQSKPFNDEAAAYAWVEARIWPNGRVCPKCGVVDRSGPLKGKTNRIGLYKCYACRKPFTVKVGTIFEDSHVQMRDWLAAIYLVCSSKKGISSNQLSRTLGVTLKTAWFMSHRIREAMKDGGLGPLGGEGMTVEVDETYLGQDEVSRGSPSKRGVGDKRMVVTLVERGGRSRSIHADKMNKGEIVEIVRKHLDRRSTMMTDEARHYRGVGREMARHGRIMHAQKKYVEGDVTTNTVEGFFSLFKRGMKGIYQHCGDKHLHRYLAEFDFRYSNRVRLGVDDVQRTEAALRGVVGKRLTYRTTGGARA